MTMRRISCQRARAFINSSLDGALTLGEREQLEAHLATCTACNAERRNAEQLDTRTRVALRGALDSYALTPQREAQIRRQVVARAKQSYRRTWPSFTIGGLVAGIAAILLVASVGLGTLRPAPSVVEQPNFVSYASGSSERDILFAERPQRAPIAAPVTITFLDPSLSAQAYAPLLKTFKAANTDVTVRIVQPGYVTGDIATLAGQSDCFVGNAAISSNDTRNAVYPLSRFTQADGQININDFFPQTLDLVTYNGQLYGLPRTAQLHLVFFDRPTLERLAVPLPQSGWNSDMFAATLDTLRKALPPNRYAFVPYDNSDAIYLLTQRGARAPQSQVHIDINATAAAISWYADLVHASDNGALFELTNPAGLSNRRDVIAAGKAAIWTGAPVANNAISPSMGIVALPADANKPTALAADAFFISKNANSAHAGACWRWIRYLSLQTFGGQRVPARYSQVHSHAYLQQVGRRQVEVITTALARTSPVEPWTSTAVAALADAIDNVTLKGDPPRGALLRVQRALETD